MWKYGFAAANEAADHIRPFVAGEPCGAPADGTQSASDMLEEAMQPAASLHIAPGTIP